MKYSSSLKPYDRLHACGRYGHSVGPELDLLPVQAPQKRYQSPCVFSMSHVEDLSGFQVHDLGNVLMPFSHGELIDGDVTNPYELLLFQTPLQIPLENAFHHIPSYSKKCGHSFNGSDGAQFNDEALEGSQAATFAVGKINGLPQHPHTAPAILFMSMKDDLPGPPSNGQCMEDPGEPTSLSQGMPPSTAPTAGVFCVSESHMVQHHPMTIFCAAVLVVFSLIAW